MKNIFKILGIALMACSLTMVACNKDDDDNTTNNGGGNNGGGNGGGTTTGSYSIVWNSQTQSGLTVSETQITDVTSNFNNIPTGATVHYLQHVAASGTQMGDEGEEYVAPIFYMGLLHVTGLSSLDISDGCYAPEMITSSSRYASVQVMDEQENVWLVDSLNYTTNISAFDATTNTVSAKLDVVLYDYYEWTQALLDAVLAAHPELQEGGYQAAMQYLQDLEDETEYYSYMDAAALVATSRANAVVNYSNFVFTAHSSK